MNATDKQYLQITEDILIEGILQENRTGFDAKFIPSATIISDLREGFPLLTTKKMFYKANFGEVFGFFRGYDNSADFRELGCGIWDQNANENKDWLASPFRKGEDDMGCVYGSTWRKREVLVRVNSETEREYYWDTGYKHVAPTNESGVCTSMIMTKTVDQLRDVIDKIINNPTDRRIIMHAWFPELFPKMCLPPCHVMYEFVPDVQHKVLHMTMIQRSCDHLLGVPFNHAGSALMLKAIAHACGYAAGQLSHQMTNVHLYENQYQAAQIQLGRWDGAAELPTLHFTTKPAEMTVDSVLEWLETINHDSYELTNYYHCAPLPKVAMAV